jgi:hypothetical protein
LTRKLLLDEVDVVDVTNDQKVVDVDREEDPALIVVQEVGPVKPSVIRVSVVVVVAVDAGRKALRVRFQASGACLRP